MPLQYFKTLYIGCEDNKEVAAPGVNNTSYLTIKNNKGHLDTINALSAPFIHSQFLYENNILREPLKHCFLINKTIETYKIKPENVYTLLESILYFLNNYQPPTNGIIISLYFSDNFKLCQLSPSTSLWPLKQDMQWKGDGDYITFHDYEKNCNHLDMKDYLNSPVGQIAQEIDKHSVYPVKRITYSMGEEEIFKTLKHTKFHVSYAGGTYHSSGIIGCPTIGIYWKYYKKNLNKTYQLKFTTDNVIEIGVKESFDINSQRGFFTYDFENKCLERKHQDTLKHCTDKFEFLNYLKGFSDITVRNKTYETG